MTENTKPRARQSISKDPAILEYLTGVSEHRRKRLKLLVEQSENGSSGSFGETVGRGGARIRQFLSPTYNNGRSIGERVARTLEHEAGLPFGWLDQDEPPSVVGGVNVTQLVQNLEETSMNEGSDELACRCFDARTVIKGLVGTDTGIPVSNSAKFSAQLLLNRGTVDSAVRAGFVASTPSDPSDNLIHRELFSLPPIRLSESTALAVSEMPVQKVVTGDVEIDAVLWLREVISTGQADLIARAKEAAAQIATPLEELEKRYADYLRRAHPGNWVYGMASIGFADLDGLAAGAVTRATRHQEASARFGDTIFNDTPAEEFCEDVLEGVLMGKFELDVEQVDRRFDARPAQRPATLSDCVAELAYWHDLYWLRSAVGNCGDTSIYVNARQDYVFRLLSRIRPRNVDEAADVFQYMTSYDGMDRAHTGSIILNLIGAPEPYIAKQGDD